MIDQQTVDAVLALVRNGASVRTACQATGTTRSAWYEALEGKRGVGQPQAAEWRDQYARAAAAAHEAMADDILLLADDTSNDVEMRVDGNGNEYETTNHDAINRSRLRVDTRKWLLSKLAPKKYGDKLELAGDATAPLTLIISKSDAKL